MKLTQFLQCCTAWAGARQGLAALMLLSAAPAAWADEPNAEEAWQFKGQATYIRQRQSSLRAAYSGPNSLGTASAYSYSFTATLGLGWRPWAGAEMYGNIEGAQGLPLSDLTGLGGFSNGEMARSSGPTLALYRARLFGRQTWALAGDNGQPAETDAVESDFNQLAGRVAKRRIVLTVGNLAVSDLFDDNAYSHDARTQFINWSLISQGAYDFAADARGYTSGVALEWFHDDWALRAGRFALPLEPNQQALDVQLFKRFGDQLELEHGHLLAGLPGRLRLTLFRDRARMARFDDALALARQTGGAPDINQVRNQVQDKWGYGLGLEQAVARNVGVFARWSRADGATETDAFTEIDRSLSAGVLIDGAAWGRVGDSLGLGGANNELSRARRNYLAAGGISFFIGDGALRYRPERVVEVFYNLQVVKGVTLSLNGQRIVNPAYNADRGPVNFLATRLHLEF